MNRGLIDGRRVSAPIWPLLAVAMLAAACSAGVGSQGSPDASAPASPTTPVVLNPSIVPVASATTAATVPATGALPQYPWLAMDLRDVRTGEIVRPANVVGKLVIIEPMAVWCSNCRAQQNEVRTALANLASADLVYISLDVDPNETEADLAEYANERGYPWHFAVASRDLARALAATFGDTVLSPPSTPKIVIAPGGTAEVSFGIKSAADLQEELVALLP